MFLDDILHSPWVMVPTGIFSGCSIAATDRRDNPDAPRWMIAAKAVTIAGGLMGISLRHSLVAIPHFGRAVGSLVNLFYWFALVVGFPAMIRLSILKRRRGRHPQTARSENIDVDAWPPAPKK